MATYKYYQPGEVIFREGYHNHKVGIEGDEKQEQGVYSLENFLATNGDLPLKDDHALYFLDTTVVSDGDGDTTKMITDNMAKNREVVVLFKGEKPVSVDYKYVSNAPKIAIKDYGLDFGYLFSGYKKIEEE